MAGRERQRILAQQRAKDRTAGQVTVEKRHGKSPAQAGAGRLPSFSFGELSIWPPEQTRTLTAIAAGGVDKQEGGPEPSDEKKGPGANAGFTRPPPGTIMVGDAKVVLLPDRPGALQGSHAGAETSCNLQYAIPAGKEGAAGTRQAPASIPVTATIQTVWGAGVDKKSPSAYGRGKMKSDRDAGNSSLEFHEACHVEDYLKFLESHPLPKMADGQPMTRRGYAAAVAKYEKDIADYQTALDDDSALKTDCAGLVTAPGICAPARKRAASQSSVMDDGDSVL